MSYLMTHLIIANEVAKRNREIGDKGKFLLGALAPDAVHMRADYVPEYKERSHVLPEHIRWGHVRTREQVEAWRKNIVDFYMNHRQDEEGDYISGYTVHMLTDDYNCVKIFGPNLNKTQKNFEDFMKEYRQEAIALDYYLYHRYSESRELFELLLDTKAVTLDGMIWDEEVHKMVEFYNGLFKSSECPDISGLKIFGKKEAENFIQNACELFNKTSFGMDLKCS